MDNLDRERIAAKEILIRSLEEYQGNTKHESVIAALDRLTQLNPTVNPAKNEELLEGQWLLISAPNFPGGSVSADGRYSYTLGRLAFNMFEPTDLKLVIDRVLQPVEPIAGTTQRTHDIIVEFTIDDDRYPQLQGIVRNYGVCVLSGNDALQVQFKGGSLEPQLGQLAPAWKAAFGQQLPDRGRSLKQRLTNLVFKLMFGLVPPSGIDEETGRVTFKMQKSPKGKLNVFYLDDELRIIQGERGTILVCQRI